MGKGIDNRHLGDGVELATLIEDHVDMGERFKTATKPAFRLPHSLGDGPHFSRDSG